MTSSAFATTGAIVATALVAVVFSVYISTLFPSIPGGDSGELVAEACHLGVAHPPGYPLFVLLGHAALRILGGVEALQDKSPAWRINCMNAMFGALAAGLVFLSTRRLAAIVRKQEASRTGTDSQASSQERSGQAGPFVDDATFDLLSVAGGVVAATLYAFSPLVWLYSVGAEVFALNNFSAALLVYLVLVYSESPTRFMTALGAFVCGLILCNQHTSVLFEVPLIVWILWTQRKVLTAAAFIGYAAAFFCGLLPYAFLPISDTYFPRPSSWGDCSTLSGFWHHFRRADYGTFRLYSRDTNAAGLTERLRTYFVDFATVQVSPPFVLQLLIGAFFVLRRMLPALRLGGPTSGTRKKKTARAGKGAKNNPPAAGHSSSRSAVVAETASGRSTTDHSGSISPLVATDTVGLALFFALMFYLIVFHTLSNMPLDDQLLFGVHARFWMQPNVIMCIFVGVGGVFFLTWASKTRLASGSPQVMGMAAVILAIAIGVHQEQRNLYLSDHSENRYLERYARALMEPLPENSIIVTGYDMQWTASRYLHICENLRPDLHVFNAPVLSYKWFARQQSLYPEVRFPGTRLVRARTKDHLEGGFTLREFFDANVDNPKVSGGLYWAGTLMFPEDKSHQDEFELIPYGLVKKVVRKSQATVATDMPLLMEKWNQVVEILGPLPPFDKYDMSTWEWTVGEDFWLQAETRGSLVLEWALANAPEGGYADIRLLFHACDLMEGTLANMKAKKSLSLYKNLGIAHARIVQHKGEWPLDIEFPLLPGLKANATKEEWKDKSSARVLFLWEKFMSMPNAKEDSSYQSIAGVVQTLRGVKAKHAAKQQQKKRGKSKKTA